MTEQDKKFLQENPDAKFVGFIKVGQRGVRQYYTNKEAYEKYRDKAWDSGHDLECRVLKDETEK